MAPVTRHTTLAPPLLLLSSATMHAATFLGTTPGSWVDSLPAGRCRPRRSAGSRCVVTTAAAEAAEAVSGNVVAVTGATGFVGSRLTQELVGQGNTVRVLTRDVSAAKRKLQAVVTGGAASQLQFYGDRDWAAGVRGASAVVNLAGEPISGRWSADTKSLILSSRVNATKRLVSAMRDCPPELRPRVLVSASAVGFYGTSLSARYDEQSPSGGDYLATVCKQWEKAALGAEELGVRVVVVRLGIVLDRGGGALAKMAPVFELFAGGPLGDGRQWMSWVHRDDAVGIMAQALRDDSWSGCYNATAPAPVRMTQLCSSLGAAMGRPSWAPVPEFVISLALGEGGKVVLEGQQVLPTRTLSAGYSFQYRDVNAALRQVVGRR